HYDQAKADAETAAGDLPFGKTILHGAQAVTDLGKAGIDEAFGDDAAAKKHLAEAEKDLDGSPLGAVVNLGKAGIDEAFGDEAAAKKHYDEAKKDLETAAGDLPGGKALLHGAETVVDLGEAGIDKAFGDDTGAQKHYDEAKKDLETTAGDIPYGKE